MLHKSDQIEGLLAASWHFRLPHQFVVGAQLPGDDLQFRMTFGTITDGNEDDAFAHAS